MGSVSINIQTRGSPDDFCRASIAILLCVVISEAKGRSRLDRIQRGDRAEILPSGDNGQITIFYV